MNYKFEKLTPVDNVELEVYNEAIDYVFKYLFDKCVLSFNPRNSCISFLLLGSLQNFIIFSSTVSS